MSTPEDWVWVWLGPKQTAWADKNATERHQNRVNANARQMNGHVADFDADLMEDIWSFRTEFAGWKWGCTIKPDLPWHWQHIVGPMPMVKPPDLGKDIEIKACKLQRHRLIVQPHEDPTRKYLLICHQFHPHYAIMGWMTGAEAKQIQKWDPHGGRAAHFVDKHLLHAPRLLSFD